MFKTLDTQMKEDMLMVMMMLSDNVSYNLHNKMEDD